jgi:hypothetical protein
MLPLRLFRSAEFAGANLLTLLLYAALEVFFLSAESNPGAGIFDDRRGIAALRAADVRLVALGRRAGRPSAPSCR